MTLIHVPKTIPQSAYDADRPLSSLLKIQVEHLYEAEKRLPPQYQSGTYVNAIRTEGEAARYIGRVTDAIRLAHEHAERARHMPKRKRVIEIAAAADERPERKRSRPMTKKESPKKKRKKS